MTGAIAALDQVPSTSRGFPESRQLRADVLLSGGPGDLALLDQAMGSSGSVPMDPRTRETYTVKILSQALDVVLAGSARPDAKVGTHPATEAGLRDGLERSYRALARDATDVKARVELVNQANATPIPAAAPVPGGQTCPSCAAAMPAGTLFCENCGASLGAPAPVDPS
eukprot:gene5172-6142_t